MKEVIDEMVAIVVPLGLFASITILLGLAFRFRYQARRDLHATVRAAIDKGHELSPELVDRLGAPGASKEEDLRRAVLWLAIGVAVPLCGAFVPDSSGDTLGGCLAAAAFPLCVGVAHLVMWRLGRRAR